MVFKVLIKMWRQLIFLKKKKKQTKQKGKRGKNDYDMT